jgi:hypothetical protein
LHTSHSAYAKKSRVRRKIRNFRLNAEHDQTGACACLMRAIKWQFSEIDESVSRKSKQLISVSFHLVLENLSRCASFIILNVFLLNQRGSVVSEKLN